MYRAAADLSSSDSSSSPSPLPRSRLPSSSRRSLPVRLTSPSSADGSPRPPRPAPRPRPREEPLWLPSPESVAWVNAVTHGGRALEIRRQQDVRAGVGSVGIRPRPPKSRGLCADESRIDCIGRIAVFRSNSKKYQNTNHVPWLCRHRSHCGE